MDEEQVSSPHRMPHWESAVALGELHGNAADLARFGELVDRLGVIRDEEREVLGELVPLVLRLRRAAGGVEREALVERAWWPLRLSVAGVRKWFQRMERGASGAAGAPSDLA
jgi:hypothetical protein